ncbi:MAG TPA: hypothetical protein VF456_04485 [Vicinamibacterales bacterium]
MTCGRPATNTVLFAVTPGVVDNSIHMKHKGSWLIPLSFFVVTSVTKSDANECMSMKVSPRQALAPVNLRVSVRVEPNAENRILTIVADSPQFYRSSQIPLEGDRAPKTFTIEYPNVPGGQYEVTSVLFNSIGRERATIRETAHVVPVGGEP